MSEITKVRLVSIDKCNSPLPIDVFDWDVVNGIAKTIAVLKGTLYPVILKTKEFHREQKYFSFHVVGNHEIYWANVILQAQCVYHEYLMAVIINADVPPIYNITLREADSAKKQLELLQMMQK